MNKPRFTHCVLALLLSGAVLTAPSALALSAKRANELRKAVTSVPVPEMPAKAAELVRHADKTDRKDVAVTVVRAAVSKRKASGPVVVAAISKVAPDLAAVVAAAASQIVTDQSANITQAAIAAAPNQSEAIIAAVANPTVQTSGNQSVTSQTGAVQINGNVATSVPSQTAPSVSANSSSSANLAASAPATPTTSIDAPVTPSAPVPSTANVTETARPIVPTTASVAPTANAVPLARGEADGNGPSSGSISHNALPINQASGGRGDGKFPGFPPNRAPAPHPKDYSKPRS